MSFVATAVVGSSLVSGYFAGEAAEEQADASRDASRASIAEQRRQFDLQRKDTAPYREAGSNALRQMTGGLQEFDYTPGQFQYEGQVPTGEPLPEFAGGDRFNFNLEADPGYQFAREEAIRAANREGAGAGKYGSGNRLAEIANRVTGIASQYANQAFNRQLAGSRENYGRGVQEYGLDYGRAQDMYGRDLSREAAQYGRALTGYGLDYQRDQDIYGQGQNYLNRLAAISGIGQSAVGQSAAAGSSMANAITNINAANAAAQGQAANTRYGGLNNAIQGGISNYLLYQYLKPQVVPGDAYLPGALY